MGGVPCPYMPVPPTEAQFSPPKPKRQLREGCNTCAGAGSESRPSYPGKTPVTQQSQQVPWMFLPVNSPDSHCWDPLHEAGGFSEPTK